MTNTWNKTYDNGKNLQAVKYGLAKTEHAPIVTEWVHGKTNNWIVIRFDSKNRDYYVDTSCDGVVGSHVVSYNKAFGIAQHHMNNKIFNVM